MFNLILSPPSLLEKQAAHTALLKEVIQYLDAFERKFDERRPHVQKRATRGHNVDIAEAVRSLHNSENNRHKYDPHTGISLLYNQAVTTYGFCWRN